MNAGLRAVVSEDGQDRTILKYADVVMDLHTWRAKRGEREIRLTPTEFRLLKLLLEHPERVFNREQLQVRIWGSNVKLNPHSVNTYLGRVRRALTACGETNIIRTIPGFGYSIDSNYANTR